MSESFFTPKVRNTILGVIFVIVLYAFFINGISTNPPGFYVDESCIAYNAYLVSQTGYSESGQFLPILYQCYTQGWTQWVNAPSMYMLAGMYTIISPSVISARIFAATWVFATILLIGLLAWRISRRLSIAVIVVITGAVTPWLFEFSRFVMEYFALLLAIAGFLLVLYHAQLRERWKITDVFLLAIGLSLITYSYATGRVIGPLFGLGLLIFAVNLRALINVIAVGVIYGLTMIPFVVMYVQDPLRVSGRFLRATNMSKGNSLLENIGVFLSAFYQDLSLKFFILEGDPLPRHHVPESGTGEFLVGTFALGLFGVLIILIRYRSNLWWRYILFGSLASLVPGAITIERNHSMRDIAFPIFFLLLMVPALSWLMGLYDSDKSRNADEPNPSPGGRLSFFTSPLTERYLRQGLLMALLLVTAVQAVQFQIVFRKNGENPTRKAVFHATYPPVLERALAEESRPIYLHDHGEPTYMLALWHAATWGVDSSNFIHLLDRQFPPEGALVISSKGTCSDCQVIFQNGGFILYRNQKPDMSQFGAPVPASPSRAPSVFVGGVGNAPGQFSAPRGIAVDTKGNIYVADTGNSRIQKFDADGRFVIEFGATGPPELLLKSPNGVAVDEDGYIYVVDVGTQKMIKFNPDGTFDREFEGPDTGFYGPRDLAIGSNKHAYINDQGRSRIVGFDLAKQSYTRLWGSSGAESAQFSGATGIAVSGVMVFVADPGNGRIQIFDLQGQIIHQWPVAAFTRAADEYPDVAFDENTKTVYVSSGKTNEILAFDLQGNPLAGFKPEGDDKLEAPTSITVAEVDKKRWLFVLNTGSSKVSKIALESPKKGK